MVAAMLIIVTATHPRAVGHRSYYSGVGLAVRIYAANSGHPFICWWKYSYTNNGVVAVIMGKGMR